MDFDLEEVVTSNGHKIKGFKGDYITKKIKKQGLYERLTLTFIRKYLSKIQNPVIADIGSNIGNHALDFSTYADRVYCFEPVKFIHDVLLENITNNKIANVVVTNKALSDTEGLDRIYICDSNVGASSILNRGAAENFVEIEKIVGDNFFEKEMLDRLDFVKIDVEGHEKFALKGMLKTIKKYKPIIMMEWNDPDAVSGFNSDGVLDFLDKIYEIRVLGNNCDKEYWDGRCLGRLRRKLAKLFLKRSVRLFPFDQDKIYRNILLTPKEVA